MGWFIFDRNLHHERVKLPRLLYCNTWPIYVVMCCFMRWSAMSITISTLKLINKSKFGLYDILSHYLFQLTAFSNPKTLNLNHGQPLFDSTSPSFRNQGSGIGISTIYPTFFQNKNRHNSWHRFIKTPLRQNSIKISWKYLCYSFCKVSYCVFAQFHCNSLYIPRFYQLNFFT